MQARVEKPAPKKITIKIDKETFHVNESSMTGHEPRALEDVLPPAFARVDRREEVRVVRDVDAVEHELPLVAQDECLQ